MKKYLILTFSYLLLFYIATICFPYDLISNDPSVCLILRSVTKLVLSIIVVVVVALDKNMIFNFKKLTLGSLLFLPLLVASFSNIIFALITNAPTHDFNGQNFAFSLMSDVAVAAIEETLFRAILLVLFIVIFENKKYKRTYAILCSSIAFALLHFLNLLSSPIIPVLTQVGYTFVLGLILGGIYVLSENIIMSMIGHLVFNFFNTTLYVSLYQGNDTAAYYIYSSILAVIILAYFIVIYFLWMKKKFKQVEKN